MPAPTLLWFRQDLRLDDNPALAGAAVRGGAVVPVFILDAASEGRWKPGAASRLWLARSLAVLAADIAGRGGRLILAAGDSAAELVRLCRETGAAAVYWNDRYEPAVRRHDAQVEQLLRAEGIGVGRSAAMLLHEPGTVLNQQGRPFQVFSPFWRHCLSRPVERPVASTPARWPAPARPPVSLEPEVFAPLLRRDADVSSSARLLADTPPILSAWTPGEAGARSALRRFLHGPIHRYDVARDQPAEAATSLLSPHFHFGEIGPRRVWSAVKALGRQRGTFPPSSGAGVFLAELGWREFAYHLLYHFPDTPERPKRATFEAFPWRPDPDGACWASWIHARTGYPIVDAGLRQLAATGWMHNRVRMIAASFLVKHLRLPWQQGAAWFWEGLVDADLANNTLGWQWVAGCGADAAPYFRIFNPVTQGRRYDAEGAYVRRWVPELAGLPGALVHAPWEAEESVLAAAGIRLGETYPRPVVDHVLARDEALAAVRSLRRD